MKMIAEELEVKRSFRWIFCCDLINDIETCIRSVKVPELIYKSPLIITDEPFVLELYSVPGLEMKLLDILGKKVDKATVKFLCGGGLVIDKMVLNNVVIGNKIISPILDYNSSHHLTVKIEVFCSYVTFEPPKK